MSDKIKSEYNRYMENVKPSDKFLSQLTSTLEEERSSQRKRRKVPIKQISAAAACLIAVCGFAVIYSFFGNDIKTGEDSSSVTENMNGYAGKTDTESLVTVPFENISWYDNALTPESLPKALAQKLESSLDYLSFAEENKFVNADRADFERTKQMIEALSEAEESDEKVTGDMTYYMAVFTDGTVAKFSISDNGAVEISGDDKIYKINKN